MTRADYLESWCCSYALKYYISRVVELDHANIVTIDVSRFRKGSQIANERKIDHNVRPDSMLILHVAREVVKQEGFAETLANVRDRIDEIESLHRTRELTVCSSSFLHFSTLTCCQVQRC